MRQGGQYSKKKGGEAHEHTVDLERAGFIVLALRDPHLLKMM